MDVTFGLETGLDQLRETVVSRWAAACMFGNLGDALSTLAFLQQGLADELNPLMLLAYQVSPMWFMAVKLSLVHLGLLLLYMNRHARVARLGERFGGVMYGMLLVWHAACWSAVPQT